MARVMSRNLPGTPSYALPDAQRRRPRGAVCLPPDLWDELDAEAARRHISRSALMEEAAREYLPRSRGLPEKSTDLKGRALP